MRNLLASAVAPLASSVLMVVGLVGVMRAPRIGRPVTLPMLSSDVTVCGPLVPISITRSGELWYDDDRVADLATLSRRLESRPGPLIILADADLPFRAVKRVIAASHARSIVLAGRAPVRDE